MAAFASSNLGDVSPNTMGAKCIDTGLPCDFVSSSCNNRTQLCIAFGPGKDMVDSTRIIGDKQFQKAWVISYFPWGILNHILLIMFPRFLSIDRTCIINQIQSWKLLKVPFSSLINLSTCPITPLRCKTPSMGQRW